MKKYTAVASRESQSEGMLRTIGRISETPDNRVSAARLFVALLRYSRGVARAYLKLRIRQKNVTHTCARAGR